MLAGASLMAVGPLAPPPTTYILSFPTIAHALQSLMPYILSCLTETDDQQGKGRSSIMMPLLGLPRLLEG